MSISSKLCNPTPFPVKLNWDRGIVIRVEPFSTKEITAAQLEDFRPGKPGSADVKSVLDYYGLFVFDPDRAYDNQALEALKRAHRAKKAQYDAAVKNINDRRAMVGVAPNAGALEETLVQLGYADLRHKIQTLEKAIQKWQGVVGDEPEYTSRPQLDPKRTVFIMDPPKEFPSVAAMEFFLDENPEIKAKHQAFQDQVTGKPNASKKPVEPEPQMLKSLGAE